MMWLRKACACLLAVTMLVTVQAGAQTPARPQQQGAATAVAGPINAVFPLAGEPIRKELAKALAPQAAWTVKGWVRIPGLADQPETVAALVDQAGQPLVELGVAKGRLFAQSGAARASSTVRGKAGEWLLVSLAATDAGIALKVGDEPAVRLAARLSTGPAALVLAPRSEGQAPFAGAVANLVMWQGAEPAGGAMAWSRPDPDLIQFESGSPAWPQQVKQYMGLTAPQDPATLPVSRSAERGPQASTPPPVTPPLTAAQAGRWTLGAWRFAAAPDVAAAPAAISSPGFKAGPWLPAVVPGTVLTSYIANGVYPDPAYGLNNLLIPERLNRQDYWFRTEFDLPATAARDQLTLVFEGINYASEIWVNGERLGQIGGAFVRGRFTLPARFRAGDRLAVAVRVSPPPHPGLPHEESLTAGPGMNGGAMSVDGPTFGASEGWDWTPSVRDRNTGIWQEVALEATGAVRLGDPHVRTVLPRPDNSLAELTIEVPVENRSAAATTVTVEARFGDVSLSQTVQLDPQGTRVVRFAPNEFAALRIKNPALWWPNGYGAPTLHRLALTARVGDAASDAREIRFGIREVSYELSLVDKAEALQRVAVAPARGGGEQLLDVTHAGIRKVKGGWAVSLARDIASSPALSAAPATPLAPHLVIKVNGVPIAVRGGNWGMDDWLKRVSRERMEPYFRLHRDANVNTIRNWMGQSTARVFFDLADEYGLLVLNDFWISTQDHNGEPGDTALFLDNAADTISRYRHHPSIALWIGRNEGVPPPVLNTGLDRLVRELDGTRAYLPNSRQVNMSGSGPWNYRQPEAYFTTLAQGFSTEIGTPSFPTLESFKTMMPEADQWPVSDAWAYHDWHQRGAGDVASFMRSLTARFGAPVDLPDFEKKAQLLNYEAHRAIFEGMNDGLFTRNSGRLLWMTHPAWPSTAWQIYSHDYDTHAAFFGTKKGSEPVHVQVNLPDLGVAVVNSLANPLGKAAVRIRNFDLAGGLLSDRRVEVDVAALATVKGEPAVADALFAQSPVVLTKLELFDSANRLLSENLYWLAREPAAYRAMTEMKPARVTVAVQSVPAATETEIRATVTNAGSVPALMVKLSLLDATGARILPAYWSDNYVSLLPGETRTVTIRAPKAAPAPNTITVGGWNVEANAIKVQP
ncbi:MAG: glycoside hydrolase family 2 [Sphingomonadaceae bacterium]|nr:glycoside hydrolase family 2 [Sphingomonadaceae bacterium]